MKKIFKINLLVLAMISMFIFAHSQQRPSQRSYSSVMNEIKQKQAARNKMMQQIKQITPSNQASQIGNTGANASVPAPVQPRSQTLQRTSEQPINNNQIHQQPQPSTKIRKE